MQSLGMTREEILSGISQQPHTQLMIIGGGIQGAALARVAALNGFACTLVERGDYASGTSSRSSKLLHGGLRYLGQFDFRQVFEGIQAREDLFLTAPHLCHPATFLIPVRRGDFWFQRKIGLGLWLYDRMALHPPRKHAYLEGASLAELGQPTLSDRFQGAFAYTDGLTDDSRLTLESILHARMLGARCLNYLEVVSIARSGNRFAVRCRDHIGDQELDLEADLVVNCAGPWAPCIPQEGMQDLKGALRYSAGSHLLFDRPWTDPALFLPMEEPNRGYFVCPHPGGTLVGTTERDVERAEFDPLPTPGEVEEILARLARDLPGSGLDRRSLYYGFAGVRSLPVRGKQVSTARLSRRHLWRWTGGVLTLLGGKLTTANLTAFEGLERAAERLGIRRPLQSLSGLPYPGAECPEGFESLTQRLIQNGLSQETAARLVGRYGGRAKEMFCSPSGLERMTPHLTNGEVELVVREEQAETIEDVLRRRTGVEYLPEAPLPALEPVARFLCERFPGRSREKEVAAYRDRLASIRRHLNP